MRKLFERQRKTIRMKNAWEVDINGKNDIPAQEKTAGESTRVPRQNGNQRRKKSSCSQKSKRQKRINSVNKGEQETARFLLWSL